MLTDPAVVTIGGTARSLVRIKQDDYSSEYRLLLADQRFDMFVKNTSRLDKATNRTVYRHTIDVTHTVFPVAPATLNTVRKAYAVLENYEGDTLVDPRNVMLGLTAYLTSANIDKLLNMES